MRLLVFGQGYMSLYEVVGVWAGFMRLYEVVGVWEGLYEFV